MEERKWCVYCHTNKINGKKYIGITSQKPSMRYGKNGYNYINGNNTKFAGAIKKYKWKNFTHKILYKNLTENEAKWKEKFLIRYYDTFKHGYNSTLGGDGTVGRSGKLCAKSRKVICNDIVFYSAIECAKYYNVFPSLLIQYLSKEKYMPVNFYKLMLRWEDLELDDSTYKKYYIIQNRSYTNPNICAKKVICDGIIFKSIGHCAKFYNISMASMKSWINKTRNMPKYFYNLKLRYYDFDCKKNKYEDCYKMQNYKNSNVFIICDDIIFESIIDCSKYYNTNRKIISNYLNRSCDMNDFFYNRQLRFSNISKKNFYKYYKQQTGKYQQKKIILEDSVYLSLKNASKKYNISMATLSSYLGGSKPMPQKWLDRGLRYYNPETDSHLPIYVDTSLEV